MTEYYNYKHSIETILSNFEVVNQGGYKYHCLNVIKSILIPNTSHFVSVQCQSQSDFLLPEGIITSRFFATGCTIGTQSIVESSSKPQPRLKNLRFGVPSLPLTSIEAVMMILLLPTPLSLLDRIPEAIQLRSKPPPLLVVVLVVAGGLLNHVFSPQRTLSWPPCDSNAKQQGQNVILNFKLENF